MKDLKEIINETAEILDDEEVLNEGIIGGILKGIMAAPFIILGFGLIYIKLESMKEKYNIKKNTKKLSKEERMALLKDNEVIIKNYENLIKQVKFVKYNPNVINMMNDYMNFTKKYDSKLEKLDNEFANIKTVTEFQSKEDSFKTKYNALYKERKTVYDKLLNKYKGINEEWVTDNGDKIIPILTNYLKTFLDWNSRYYKNTDGDDFWERLSFLSDWNDEEEYNEDIINNAYYIWQIVSEPMNIIMENNNKFKDPFKYIKMQFAGDKPIDEKER